MTNSRPQARPVPDRARVPAGGRCRGLRLRLPGLFHRGAGGAGVPGLVGRRFFGRHPHHAAQALLAVDHRAGQPGTGTAATSTSFWTISHVSLRFVPPARAVRHSLLSAHARRMLIGACDPTVCPIHVFFFFFFFFSLFFFFFFSLLRAWTFMAPLLTWPMRASTLNSIAALGLPVTARTPACHTVVTILIIGLTNLVTSYLHQVQIVYGLVGSIGGSFIFFIY